MKYLYKNPIKGNVTLAVFLFTYTFKLSTIANGEITMLQSGKYMYTKIFTDYQNSSYQDQVSKALGNKKWFKPSIDKDGYGPRLVLTTSKGVIVQYRLSIELIDYNGKAVWEVPNDPEMNVFSDNTLIYARDGARGVITLNFDGNEVSKQRISTGSMGAFIDFLFPLGETFLAQTFSRKLAAPGKPKRSVSCFVLMKQHRPVWIQKYNERYLPGLLNRDKSKVILISNKGSIKILKPETGEELDAFDLEGFGPLQASIDHSDNLILSTMDSKRNRKIIHCSLKGNINWEFLLPRGEERPFCQPPGVDSNNRVYYICNNTLLVINAGKMEWKTTVFQAKYYQYFTILGDNNVLVASVNRLQFINSDGEELFNVHLPVDENISTPPVIDDNGNIYFGTEKGIYCFE